MLIMKRKRREGIKKALPMYQKSLICWKYIVKL